MLLWPTPTTCSKAIPPVELGDGRSPAAVAEEAAVAGTDPETAGVAPMRSLDTVMPSQTSFAPATVVVRVQAIRV